MHGSSHQDNLILLNFKTLQGDLPNSSELGSILSITETKLKGFLGRLIVGPTQTTLYCEISHSMSEIFQQQQSIELHSSAAVFESIILHYDI